MAALLRAVAIHDKLAAEGRDRAEPGEENLPFTHTHRLSVIARTLGRTQQSEQASDRAFRLAEQRLSETPNDAEARRDMALAMIDRAHYTGMHGRLEETEQLLRKAVAIVEPLVAEVPTKASTGSCWHSGRPTWGAS